MTIRHGLTAARCPAEDHSKLDFYYLGILLRVLNKSSKKVEVNLFFAEASIVWLMAMGLFKYYIF